jgi:histidine triad (HIT) family protein
MNAPRDACPFCDYAGPNTILWETPGVYAVAPLREVTPGHTLVIPRAHAEDFADDPSITAAAFRGAAEFAQANGVEDANLITSKGAVASQTIHHIHVHVLPRTWDDAVRLPWNNPHESPSPTHHLYRRYLRESAALQETLRALHAAEGGRFDWEVNEASQLVGHARRYMGKVGEVLYCGWPHCLHADEPEDRFREHATDYRGRAIPIGEGEQWFKGRIHTDCWEAMKEQDT